LFLLSPQEASGHALAKFQEWREFDQEVIALCESAAADGR
jgi:hypothetical protein